MGLFIGIARLVGQRAATLPLAAGRLAPMRRRAARSWQRDYERGLVAATVGAEAPRDRLLAAYAEFLATREPPLISRLARAEARLRIAQEEGNARALGDAEIGVAAASQALQRLRLQAWSAFRLPVATLEFYRVLQVRAFDIASVQVLGQAIAAAAAVRPELVAPGMALPGLAEGVGQRA